MSPSFPATPSKSWGPVKAPFLKIWLEAQPIAPPQQKGAHYEQMDTINRTKLISYLKNFLNITNKNTSKKYSWRLG